MKAGGWSLGFDPEATPFWVRRRMTFFSNIMITATYAGPDESFESLKDRALWAGIITRRALRRGEISGLGLLGYLATGKASAGIWHSGYETISFPATFEDIVEHWFDAAVEYGNGIRLGANLSATATTVESLSEGVLPDLKQSLDTAAAQTGNEYRVGPDGLIDFGTAVYTARQILVSPDVRTGVSGDWLFWTPTNWDPESDVDDYRNTGRVLIEDKTASGVGPVDWNAPGVVPMMRTYNNSYTHTCIYTNLEKTVESLDVSDATAVAVVLAGNRASPRFATPCAVQVPAITRHIQPGDSLWIHDPLEGIVGADHTGIPGHDVAALEQRVHQVTWPVEHGMGVYLVDGTFLETPDVPVVTDLTPWVQWETGPAQLELGPPVSISGSLSLTD